MGASFFNGSHPLQGLKHTPFDFSTVCGKHFAALEYVSPGHVSKVPFLIVLINVDFTGNPATVYMYCNGSSTLVILLALCAAGVVGIVVV